MVVLVEVKDYINILGTREQIKEFATALLTKLDMPESESGSAFPDKSIVIPITDLYLSIGAKFYGQ